jgi:alpha-L-fucosidase
MVKKDMEWFKKARFGMFIHWGLYSITGRDMWYYSMEEVKKEHYERLFKKFDPISYDPAKWANLAKKAGMKYAVFVAKHHDGFCLWDSKFTDFKVTNTPYGKDLLRPWLEAFRAEGFRIGIYYSLIDWHHPHFTVDCIHPQRADIEKLNDERDFKIYVDFMHKQIRELMSEYGKIDIFWPDFSYGTWPHHNKNELKGKGAADWQSEDIIKMIEELQPGILCNGRMGLPGEIKGDFSTPEQYIPDKDITGDEGTVMWETCETLGSGWGYCRGDTDIKTPGMVIKHIVTCVSNNGNLLLNVGPTPRGTIQDEFADCLERVGKWMDINGESIYGAGTADIKAHQTFCPEFHPVFTQKGKDIYMHCFEHYPPYDVIIRNMGEKVDYIEFVSDKTEIEFESVMIDDNLNLKLHMPVIKADPYNTVIRISLKKTGVS